MRLLATFLFAVLVSGCGAPPLRPDPVQIAAPDANAFTAEFQAAGRLWSGVAVLPLRSGRPISDLGLSIQGYHEGTIALYSPTCEIDDSVTYRGSALVPIQSDFVPTNNCTILFYVIPRFDGEQNQSVVIRSFKGFIRVRTVAAEDKFIGYTDQIPQGGDAEISIPADIPTPVIVRAGGICPIKSSDDLVRTPENGIIRLRLSDMELDTSTARTCIISGFYNRSDSQPVFNWAVAIHSSRYNHLPTPSVRLEDSKLKIRADTAVSLLSVGREYKFGNEAEWPQAQADGTVMRALTVAGRSKIGLIRNGLVDWLTYKTTFSEVTENVRP